MSEEKPKISEPAENFYRKHKITRFATKMVLNGFMSPFPREPRTGLLEGSILGYSLSHPRPDSDQLVYRRTNTVRSIAYDFQRPEVFSKEDKRYGVPQKFEGRLFGFHIQEVKDNAPDVLTPYHLFNVCDPAHMFSIDSYTADKLTKEGLAIKTTHKQAYENVDLYEQYAEDLAARSMEDAPVFQITPKGNTLVFVIPDNGDARPKRVKNAVQDLLPGLKPAF